MVEKYLNNRFYTLSLFPFLLGALTVFSYQPFNLTLINFFVLPILFYLIIFVKKKSQNKYRKKPFRKNLFYLGTSFGFGFYISGIHWISNSLTFDDSFLILIPFSLILIPLFLSLFFSLTILIVGPFLSFNLKSIFLLAGSLSVSDYLRAKILTGFPWNLWGYSFSWASEIIQILNNIGLFAFNLISITIFILPAILFFNISLQRKLFGISFVIFTVFILFLNGNYAINKNKNLINSIEEKVNFKIVSPNFNLNYNLSLKDIELKLDKLLRFSNPENDLKTIFIWPEGVFSGYSYNDILIFKSKFLNNFNKNHYIVFGINRMDDKSGGYYNSLLVVNHKMKIIKEYRKQKLVPFGEFLPFQKILSSVGIKKITEGYGSYLKGKNQKNLVLENLNILPLICYEIIFTELTQESNNKTNIIINISEDGWFGKTIGPHQHFSKAIFRAIEHNTYLLRSANKGISAIIDNKGKVVKKLKSDEAGNIELQVPLIKKPEKNKNDLIFFILLFTYILFFNLNKNKNV